MTYFIKNSTNLKNLFLLFAIILISATTTNAQTLTPPTKEIAKKTRKATKFKKGDVEVKLGYGLVPILFGKESQSLVAPLSASLTYRVGTRFSIGAYVGYTSQLSGVKQQLNGSSYQYENNNMIIGFKAQSHIISVENFDFYGGMMLAYNKPFVTANELTPPNNIGSSDIIPSVNPTPHNPNGPSSSILPAGYVGGSYYFSKNANAFAEVGYGISIVTVGLGYKF